MVSGQEIKVSVIIPVYNREEYIAGCLDSVMKQTLTEKEVICVDDGSTDSTVSVIKKYAEKYKNIVLLTQTHGGEGAARNHGMKKARGEYIAFMDSDDWYPDDGVLEYMYSKAKEYDVLMAGGNIITVDSTNPSVQFAARVSNFTEEKIVAFADKKYMGGVTSFIYRRDFLTRNQISFSHSTVYADTFFVFMAQLKAKKILQLPRSVYVYRIAYRDTTVTRSNIHDMLDVNSKILKLAKDNNLPFIQKSAFSSFETKPIYQYAALEKGEFLDGVECLWKLSMFDKETTGTMILSKDDIDDLMANGKRYEDDFISDIKRYNSCVVYGYTDGITKFLLSYLKDNFDINIRYITVSRGYLSQKDLRNIPMLEIDDLVGKVDPDETVFLVGTHLRSHEAIKANIERFGFGNIRLIDFRKLQLFPHAFGMKFSWS